MSVRLEWIQAGVSQGVTSFPKVQLFWQARLCGRCGLIAVSYLFLKMPQVHLPAGGPRGPGGPSHTDCPRPQHVLLSVTAQGSPRREGFIASVYQLFTSLANLSNMEVSEPYVCNTFSSFLFLYSV